MWHTWVTPNAPPNEFLTCLTSNFKHRSSTTHLNWGDRQALALVPDHIQLGVRGTGGQHANTWGPGDAQQGGSAAQGAHQEAGPTKTRGVSLLLLAVRYCSMTHYSPLRAAQSGGGWWARCAMKNMLG
jgi:hypothetical protein